MNGVERHAEFYRGYLIDDRSLIPLKRGLASIVVLWLIICLVAAVCPPRQPPIGERVAHAAYLGLRSP
jgi:hypothetical protein